MPAVLRPRAAVGADPERGGDLAILSNFPSGLEAAAGCIECLSGAASVLARRASQERRMTSPTAGRIGYAGAHTDHVNPDRAGNKSATFRSGLSPVPAPPGRHKDREWSRRCNQRSQGSTCFYDEQHRITYLRMLDADAEGADWREVSRIILRIDPEREPARARRAFESHLERAKWGADSGYRRLLRQGWPSAR